VRGSASTLVAFGLVVSLACSRTASTAADAGGCVDFEPTASDLSCGSDNDCFIIVSGLICSTGPCGCGGAPSVVNVAGATRFMIQTTSLPSEDCETGGFCDAALTALCASNTCVLCGTSNEPDACGDAGS
jgi:hypothetical protein